MSDLPIALEDDIRPTNHKTHPYDYTVCRTGILTDKQFNLVEEIRKEGKKYKITVTDIRHDRRYVGETKCKPIDEILSIWFDMVAKLKVKARRTNFILINNVDDEFLTITYELTSKQTTIYKLATE